MNIFAKCRRWLEITGKTNSGGQLDLLPSGKTNAAAPEALLPLTGIVRELCMPVYYISDIHLEYQINRAFPRGATDREVKAYTKKIARGLFPNNFIAKNRKLPIVLFGGDVTANFTLAKIFYTEFMRCWNELELQRRKNVSAQKYIYAVLGNHELWGFKTLEKSYAAYKELFDKLGFCFLNNTVTWFGEYKTCENELYRRYIHNVMIVGGIGFAGCNDDFNANNGIYQNVLCREREIIETEKWQKIYQQAVMLAKENKCVLMVLTHNPFSDWKSDHQPDCGCIYFNGHNHRNYLYHDPEANVHIFANNQIGYRKRSKILLKKAYIYNRWNPFAGYTDGYFEIKSTDYIMFYDYVMESISGNGVVEYQIKTNNAKFFMVKHSGYYGFFLTSRKGTYICAGGRIKKISKANDIEQFDLEFTIMVGTYLRLLSPYRNAQEQIAKTVRSFGGEGTIHGCIIDVDFFNHIMLNPLDGKITYYSSPSFGWINPYESLQEMLANNKILEKKYKERRQKSKIPENKALIKGQIDITGDLIQIDIKGSAYALSNRINQIQRLFDKKILRDWNEELLMPQQNNSPQKLK